MPLYEHTDSGLEPFRRLRPSSELYESEIEDLIWSDLEAFTGESLFPVARQARISGGGVPDVLALDDGGRVIVIEVKRDIDRGQLAQCLEYAGWARLTNLDEISGLCRRGPSTLKPSTSRPCRGRRAQLRDRSRSRVPGAGGAGRVRAPKARRPI